MRELVEDLKGKLEWVELRGDDEALGEPKRRAASRDASEPWWRTVPRERRSRQSTAERRHALGRWMESTTVVPRAAATARRQLTTTCAEERRTTRPMDTRRHSLPYSRAGETRVCATWASRGRRGARQPRPRWRTPTPGAAATPRTRRSRMLDIMGLAHLFNISIKLYGPYMYINGFIPYGNLIERRLYLNT